MIIAERKTITISLFRNSSLFKIQVLIHGLIFGD
jgi:hypothetical protein